MHSDMQDRDGNKSGEDGSKDENAVNHEIATLLLNLASRTHTTESYKNQSSKPDPDVAMDLSNYAKSNSLPGPARLGSPNTNFHSTVPTSSNPYSLFPTSNGLNTFPAFPTFITELCRNSSCRDTFGSSLISVDPRSSFSSLVLVICTRVTISWSLVYMAAN